METLKTASRRFNHNPTASNKTLSDIFYRRLYLREYVVRKLTHTKPEMRSLVVSDGYKEIKITLPHIKLPNYADEKTYIGGELDPEENGRRPLVGFMLHVNPELRGNKIGERLLRNLIAAAKEQGATDYYAAIQSQYSLKIMGDVFGSDNISADSPKGPSMTFDEAMEFLKKAEEHKKNLENRNAAAIIQIDLTTIDTTEWEHPVEI